MWLIGAIVVADINALYSGMCTRPANMSRVWHAKSRAPRLCRAPASQLYWKRAACVRRPWCGAFLFAVGVAGLGGGAARLWF